MRVELVTGEPIEITTVAERPELAGKPFDAGEWPKFMEHNQVSEAFFWRLLSTFPEVCLIATTENGAVVANAHAVRLARTETWREQLPSGGWEQVVVQAFRDVDREVTPDLACALNISVATHLQRNGLAGLMLDQLRSAARAAGAVELLAPVRPTWKHHEPRTPIAEYAERTRADGLPFDPWLRTHVRTGGQLAGIASTSWVIAASLAQWRGWTGLPFDRTGDVEVTGGLVPVKCDVAFDQAVYVEPNIWVRHDLRT